MKKKISIKDVITFIAITLSFTFTSCKKGDTGPAGPTGANGVSNIQTSNFTTTNSSWSFDPSDNSYNTTISWLAITQSIIDKGTIQVFLGDGSNSQWAALPASFGDNQINYSYKLGQVIISITLSTGAAPTNPGGQQFKIVIIPPTARMANPTVNYKNYLEVKRAFNLKD